MRKKKRKGYKGEPCQKLAGLGLNFVILMGVSAGVWLFYNSRNSLNFSGIPRNSLRISNVPSRGRGGGCFFFWWGVWAWVWVFVTIALVAGRRPGGNLMISVVRGP